MHASHATTTPTTTTSMRSHSTMMLLVVGGDRTATSELHHRANFENSAEFRVDDNTNKSKKQW